MLENYPHRVYESAVVVTTDSRTSTTIEGGQSSIGLSNSYRQGVSVPDWKIKVAKGQDASSYYRRYSTRVIKTAHLVNAGYKAWTANFPYTIRSQGRFECVGQIVTPYSGGDVETRSVALKRLKSKLQAASGRKDVMVPVAELTELRRGIKSQAQLSLRFVKDIQKLKLRKVGHSARNTASNMQDAWLNYSFMMAPMVSDTKDIAESISAYVNKSGLSASRVRASATKEGIESYVPPTSVTTNTFACQWSNVGWVHYKLSYLFTGGWDLFLRSSNNYSALDHFGIRLAAVPAVLWEKLGMSWMVDYFVNVGPFLDDVFFSPPGVLKYLVENIRYESSHEHIFTHRQVPGAANANYSATTVSDSARLQYRSFTRTPLGALPYGSLYVKSFDSIGKNAVSKLLNLTSIVFKIQRR